MMRKARELMKKWGASFLISGEVLGQRPMSQRRDTLNVIRRDAEVKESLLRPLSAQLLDPTAPEISGLVDRNKLLGIFGRGRKSQMALPSNGPERDPHTRRRVQTGGKGKVPALLAGPDAPQRTDRLKTSNCPTSGVSTGSVSTGCRWAATKRTTRRWSVWSVPATPSSACVTFRALSHLPASSPRGTTKRFRTQASLDASYSPKGRPGRRGVSRRDHSRARSDQRREHLRQCGAQAHPRPSVGRARIRRCPQSHQGGEPAHV